MSQFLPNLNKKDAQLFCAFSKKRWRAIASIVLLIYMSLTYSLRSHMVFNEIHLYNVDGASPCLTESLKHHNVLFYALIKWSFLESQSLNSLSVFFFHGPICHGCAALCRLTCHEAMLCLQWKSTELQRMLMLMPWTLIHPFAGPSRSGLVFSVSVSHARQL